MAVVLDDDVFLVSLDALGDLAQGNGTTDAGHVLQTNLVGACVNELLGQVHIILHGVDGAVGDAQGGLGNHAGLLGILNGGNYVAGIVQSAEDAGDVGALSFLHFVEQLAQVLGARAHAKAVEGAVQHVGLYACLVERLGPFAHTLVGVLAIEQVHLLEASAVGLHTVEASHADDGGRHLQQLVHTGLVLACALPHIAEHEAELHFSFHILFTFFVTE